MLTHPTLDQLRALKLDGAVYGEIAADPAGTGQALLVTAVAFAIGGLSGDGSFFGNLIGGLVAGVIGLIIASLVNLFLQSSAMSFVISGLGVLIFAGLTAYDTQRLKEEYAYLRDTAYVGKAVIMGALSLYLDFVNMFMYLLRFLGNRE